MLTVPCENPLSGRTVKCPRCGKELFFAVGDQMLVCPFCGYDLNAADAGSPAPENPPEEYRPFATYEKSSDQESRPETVVGRRIGRLEHLAKTIVVIGVWVVLSLFSRQLDVTGDCFSHFFQLPVVEELIVVLACARLAFCCFLIFCLAIPLWVKRLHDLNLSGWWVLFYVVVQNVIKNVGHAGLSEVWEWGSTLFALFLLIWPGDKDVNRFGRPAVLPDTIPGRWGLVVRSPLVTKIFCWMSAILLVLSLLSCG